MRVNPALLVAVTLSGCGAPDSRTPPAPLPTVAPAARDLEGTVQDNAGRPPAASVSVTLDGYQTSQTVTAGTDGRFAFKSVTAGTHTLSAEAGGRRLYVRLASGSAESQLRVEIDVPVAAGPFSLGTLYAESYEEHADRIAKTFGPHCTRAFANKPLGLSEEHMPLRLERLERGEWKSDDTFEPSQLTGVAAVCKQVTMDEVGRYSQVGDNAYNYTWELVVVLRDGKSLRQNFHAPAPLVAPTGQFGVKTGQHEKLGSESGEWLAGAIKR
jgi:hypothetical protein